MRKTRKLYKNKKAGTVESAAKIKATVIAVKKNSKTIKNYKEENSILENRISLLESIVKKQEKQIDTINTTLMEALLLEHNRIISTRPRGTNDQKFIEYIIKRLQGRTVEKKDDVPNLLMVQDRLKKLKDNWVTVIPEGPGAFKAVYK